MAHLSASCNLHACYVVAGGSGSLWGAVSRTVLVVRDGSFPEFSFLKSTACAR